MLPRLLLALLLSSAVALFAAEEKSVTTTQPRQYIYVLRLIPRLHDDNAWSEADRKTIGTHFAHLKAATAEGKVILVGRTMEPGDKTFGIVIFEAADEPAAKAFAESDPAVAGKIMTAEVRPFAVVLQRSPK